LKLTTKLNGLNRYPFHMPGHKRNGAFNIVGSDIDITEIDGFDNLHNPTGVLLDIENRLSSIYKSEKSFMLVNGSTGGILAAVFALCKENDKIIIARNCHKSVYNACMLRKLRVSYIEPSYDYTNGCYKRIGQQSVDLAVKENPDAAAIVITSPTYEGMISNVNSPIPMIIDAAHGAENPHGSVKDTKRPLHLCSEVYMARSVYYVYLLALPIACRGGAGYGYSPVLFLLHPVHCGFAVVDFPNPVVLSGIVENPLGRSRLPCVYVGHYAYVSDVL